MSREQEQIKICEYLVRRLEKELPPQEEGELKEYLKNNADGMELCVSVASLYAQLSIPKKLNFNIEETKTDASLVYTNLLQELWEDEKKAESVIPVETHSAQSLIEHVLYPPREKRRISKFSLFSLIISAAALIFIILFIYIAPPQSGLEVATLTDSINAKWADKNTLVSKDARFSTGDTRLLLREGLVELLFDNNTKVIMEAPAEFQILTGDHLRLNYGRLYAVVPQGAIGFTVNTPSARIIDLGTEFGVEADFRGDCSVHVMKGKTLLIAGSQSNKVSVEVGKGLAKKISFAGQTISDISCDSGLFARNIDSQNKLVWRGQTEIDLADIVGGGNGFGGGVLNTGIDVTTGKTISQLVDQQLFTGSPGYQIVDGSPYIDGVFFPGLLDGKTRIASDESIAVQFPKTPGTYWGYIFNGALHKGNDVPEHPLQMEGVVFGKPDNPAITIHSNQGITFDLSRIRTNITEGKITQFRSLIGISQTVQTQLARLNSTEQTTPAQMESMLKATYSKAVFWVFIDGKKVYEGMVSNSDKPVGLEIPITATDRFLTLAVTESDDSCAYDWALFGRPKLIIESTQ